MIKDFEYSHVVTVITITVIIPVYKLPCFPSPPILLVHHSENFISLFSYSIWQNNCDIHTYSLHTIACKKFIVLKIFWII